MHVVIQITWKQGGILPNTEINVRWPNKFISSQLENSLDCEMAQVLVGVAEQEHNNFPKYSRRSKHNLFKTSLNTVIFGIKREL